jgi:hypothetical protein
MKTILKNNNIVGLLLLMISCQDNSNPLPALTQEGKGIIACYVDGQIWKPYTKDFKSSSSVARYLAKEKTLYVGGYNEDTDTGISFGISNYTGRTGEYIMDNLCVDLPRIENNCAELGRNRYGANEINAWTNKTYLGKVTVMAHTDYFVSGTFEFSLQDIKTGKIIKISEGRFDMPYITYL